MGNMLQYCSVYQRMSPGLRGGGGGGGVSRTNLHHDEDKKDDEYGLSTLHSIAARVP